MRNLFWPIFVTLAFYLAMTFLTGCAATTAIPKGPPTPVPPLHNVQVSLDLLIPIALVAALVSVGLYFFVPEGHKLWATLAGCAGTVEIGSLLLRVSLWIIPWVAGGLGVAALGLVGWKVYKNWGKIESSSL